MCQLCKMCLLGKMCQLCKMCQLYKMCLLGKMFQPVRKMRVLVCFTDRIKGVVCKMELCKTREGQIPRSPLTCMTK